MRAIDADAFAEYIKNAIKTQKYDSLKVNDTTLTVGDVLESVVAELEGTSIDGFKNNPTIEPQPERIRGRWIDDGQYAFLHRAWKCTECGKCVIEVDEPWFKFCPNCGADMRGDSDANTN